MNRLSLWVIAAGSMLLISGCSDSKQKHQAKPNILIILSDDQGWGDMSAHGNEVIKTPTLDSLSKISVSFERFYVSPVCAPTRASLLTGRYHLTTGTTWVTSRMEVMREQEVTMAEILKSSGYRTGIFGKWHNGSQYPHDPTGQGFDTFFGFSEGHLNNYFDTKLLRNRTEEQTKGYVPDLITHEAIDFISNDGPFFCYVAFNTPHSPFQVPDSYFDKYKAKGLDDRMASIYGMVENMDDNINRLLTALTSQGKGRETIVIFMSDNGPNGARYNGNLKGTKAHVDEGGIRVPFFIHYPAGEIQMKKIDAKYFGAHIDVLPTVADLAGIKLPDTLDIHGRSLVPLLRGQEENWADRYFYTHQVNRKFDTIPGAIRTEQYALTIKPSDTSFYDILKDPFQAQSIATQHPELVENYLSEYRKWFLKATAKGVTPELIQVGHPNIVEVTLPAQECVTEGQVTFQGDGWANDWLIHWRIPSDIATWTVRAVESQKYTLILNGSATAPGRFVVSIDDHEYPLEILYAKNAAVIPNRDRFQRSEVEEKEWKAIADIEVDVTKGIHSIQLRPVSVSGDIEVKSIVLKKIPAF